MTPPIFNLGDEVETKDGTRFKISQIKMDQDGSVLYSTFAYPYYHASELRLVNEKPLSPMQVTCTYDPVDCEYRAIQASCPCGRKAEIAAPAELKIGDWVEVIGKPARVSCEYHMGEISHITEIRNVEYEVFGWWFKAPSLRKLTPEEALCHITRRGPISIEGQLSAIEKRLSAIETLQFSQQDAIVHFENRLTFVEKFQRYQDNLMGRAIRDGVVEISDFRRKA